MGSVVATKAAYPIVSAQVGAILDYDVNTDYVSGDHALYQGYPVTANADIAAGTSFAWGTTGATWIPTQFSGVFAGAYDAGATYAAGSVVAADLTSTALYSSKVASNTGNALNNTSFWESASFNVSPASSIPILAYQVGETYYAGQSICYNGLIVTPNATVAAGTPFAWGTSGATFKLDIDKSTAQYSSKILGELVYKAGLTESNGLKYCNGQALSRTTYAKLFAEIGTAYGAGDGSTTFNVPDMRGRVPGGAGQGVFASVFASTAVNVTSNVITVTDNNTLYTGAAAVLSTSGTAPAGLTAGSTYYVIRDSATAIRLATTRANAVAGTAIDITGQGTGNHTLTITLTNRALGSVAGEEEHSLTIAEIPSHTHNFSNTYSIQYSSDAFNTNTSATDEISRTETTQATGGSGSHNIMQPTAFAGYWFIYTGVIVE